VSAIAVRGARKSYTTVPVLDGLDLQVTAGSITAVLGVSGSGKTTLLRCIAGFERLDAGSIAIAGRVVDDVRTVVHAQHRGVGYVPQEGALFPHLRVNANIAFGLRRADRRRVAELIDMLGLQSLERRFPHQLSGGQRQRVALARALAPRPAVLLLDEPFSSLDASLRAALRQQVTELLHDLGATAILVTHDRDEALSMADQIALLRNGRITAVGTPRDLYATPADEQIAKSLGIANLVAVKVIAGQLHCHIPIRQNRFELADGAYTVLLRPEHLSITTQPTGDAIAAVVAAASYQGSATEVRLSIDNDSAPDLVATVPGQDKFSIDQRVWVTATDIGIAWPESPAGPDERVSS
jgi:iron(III) transport system ATP-binding protein